MKSNTRVSYCVEPHGGTQVDDWWCLGGALYARFGGSFQAQVNHLQLLRKEQRKSNIYIVRISIVIRPKTDHCLPSYWCWKPVAKSSAERWQLFAWFFCDYCVINQECTIWRNSQENTWLWSSAIAQILKNFLHSSAKSWHRYKRAYCCCYISLFLGCWKTWVIREVPKKYKTFLPRKHCYQQGVVVLTLSLYAYLMSSTIILFDVIHIAV